MKLTIMRPTNKHTTIVQKVTNGQTNTPPLLCKYWLKYKQTEKFSPRSAPRCEGVCRAWRQEVQHLVASGKLQRQVVLHSRFVTFPLWTTNMTSGPPKQLFSSQHLVSGKLQRQVVLHNCFGAFDNPFEQPEWLAVPLNNFSPPSFEYAVPIRLNCSDVKYSDVDYGWPGWPNKPGRWVEIL